MTNVTYARLIEIPTPLWLACCMVLLATSVPAAAAEDARPTVDGFQGERVVQFDIRETDLAAALVTYSLRTGLSVLVAPQASDTPAKPLRGRFAILEGIERLLDGTDFEYEFEGNVLVVRHAATRRAQAGRGGAAEGTLGIQQGASGDDDGRTEVIVVRGTRLDGGDPTARILVMGGNEIPARVAARGEDVSRAILQNYPTENRAHRLLQRDLWGFTDTTGYFQGIGTTGVNLRGLGSANSLVLLNGRRMAGAAGQQAMFANIRHIPASLESVYVYLDGGSAVFGSEAMAGVVDFRTNRAYSGMQVRARAARSSTDGHLESVMAVAGREWHAGNITLLASAARSDPVSTAAAGWTSYDYGSRPDRRYSFVGLSSARAGLVGFSFWGPIDLILPPGHDGRNAGREDFSRYTYDDLLDDVPTEAIGQDEDWSGLLTWHQQLNQQLELDVDLYVAGSGTVALRPSDTRGPFRVPASNAFNPFGREAWVWYSAATEVALGLVEPETFETASRLSMVAAGVRYEPTPGVALKLDYTRSMSRQRVGVRTFGQRDLLPWDGPVNRRLDELLASSDPEIAVNLFGDGTGQTPTFAEFVRTYVNERGAAHLESLEGYMALDWLELPGGTAELVLGGEVRRESVANRSGLGRSLFEDAVGVRSPTRRFASTFAEVRIPVISNGRTRGLRGLTLVAQVHNDRYSAVGATGTLRSAPACCNGSEGFTTGKQTFEHRSTRFAFAWQVTDTLVVHASRAEAFSPPLFTALFNANVRRDADLDAVDPLLSNTRVNATLSVLPNLDLRPERATNMTARATWKPLSDTGVQVDLAWSRIEQHDRVFDSYELYYLLPLEVWGRIPQFFRRDAEGRLLERIFTHTNFGTRVHTAIDGSAAWATSTPWGEVSSRVDVHYVVEMYDRFGSVARTVDYVGKSSGVDRYRARGSVHWRRGRYEAGISLKYTPGYVSDEFCCAHESVDSHLTLDAVAAYRADNGLLAQLGARNLLGEDPPFVVMSGTYAPWDPRRVDLRKRVLFLEVGYEF